MPISCKVGHVASKQWTATLVVPRILEICWLLYDHSEMYNNHSDALKFSNRLQIYGVMKSNIIVFIELISQNEWEKETLTNNAQAVCSSIGILSISCEKFINMWSLRSWWRIKMTSSFKAAAANTRIRCTRASEEIEGSRKTRPETGTRLRMYETLEGKILANTYQRKPKNYLLGPKSLHLGLNIDKALRC